MLRAVLPPLVTAYAIHVAMVLRWRRRPVPRSRPRRAPPSAPSIALAVAAGYGAFLAIVLVFHVWLAGEADVLPSAVWGGGFLTAVALVAALGTSAFAARGRRRDPGTGRRSHRTPRTP